MIISDFTELEETMSGMMHRAVGLREDVVPGDGAGAPLRWPLHTVRRHAEAELCALPGGEKSPSAIIWSEK